MKKLLTLLMALCSTLTSQSLLAESTQNSAMPDFTCTDDELQQIEKWKNASLEVLVHEAHHGDVGGLYVLGMSYLMGQKGNCIDIERANFFFSAAASLGFAPALHKIKAKCQWNDENLYLTLVYLNLIASSGHPEYVMAYHKQRNEVSARYGQAVAKEIERIATEKITFIAKNKQKLEAASDKSEFILKELFISGGIVASDGQYNHAYWNSVK